MEIDLELYRREITVATQPRVRLSAIDLAPDGAHKTVVLLHGFGGQATQWRYQLQHFGLTHRVLALDLRGHGRSDQPTGGYTLPTILQDLDQAFAQLQVADRFILAGHSFGGAIATEYALAHPERTEHLILIATPGEFKLNRLSRAVFRLPRSMLPLLQRFTRSWLHAPLAILKPWHQQVLAPWQGWAKFPRLTVSTLVIRGHLDFLFERPLFEEVPKLIPGAEDVDVGASGHLVMLERRAAVNRALERVIEGSSTRSWRDPTSLARALCAGCPQHGRHSQCRVAGVAAISRAAVCPPGCHSRWRSATDVSAA
jgi:pimeloyl-ACP methyl ester carboxylesterase